MSVLEVYLFCFFDVQKPQSTVTTQKRNVCEKIKNLFRSSEEFLWPDLLDGEVNFFSGSFESDLPFILDKGVEHTSQESKNESRGRNLSLQPLKILKLQASRRQINLHHHTLTVKVIM